MKMIDGDKLRKHLDYLIEKDNQFAKMCNGNDDFNRQRKYCFEVDVLAYELCKRVMDYYLVKDVQPIDRWISCKDEMPPIGCDVIVCYNQGYVDIGYYGISAWFIRGNSFEERAVSHWQPLPEPPKEG